MAIVPSNLHQQFNYNILAERAHVNLSLGVTPVTPEQADQLRTLFLQMTAVVGLEAPRLASIISPIAVKHPPIDQSDEDDDSEDDATEDGADKVSEADRHPAVPQKRTRRTKAQMAADKAEAEAEAAPELPLTQEAPAKPLAAVIVVGKVTVGSEHFPVQFRTADGSTQARCVLPPALLARLQGVATEPAEGITLKATGATRGEADQLIAEQLEDLLDGFTHARQQVAPPAKAAMTATQASTLVMFKPEDTPKQAGAKGDPRVPSSVVSLMAKTPEDGTSRLTALRLWSEHLIENRVEFGFKDAEAVADWYMKHQSGVAWFKDAPLKENARRLANSLWFTIVRPAEEEEDVSEGVAEAPAEAPPAPAKRAAKAKDPFEVDTSSLGDDWD